MTWQDALEIVIARTGHDRFRFFCSEANPCPYGREAYRELVVRLASGDLPPALPAIPYKAPAMPAISCCGS